MSEEATTATRQRTVWKFPLGPLHGPAYAWLPEGAAILHFDIQGGEPTIWALVDPERPTEQRKFEFVGTGHPLLAERDGFPSSYIGTCFSGLFVWHLFEAKDGA